MDAPSIPGACPRVRDVSRHALYDFGVPRLHVESDAATPCPDAFTGDTGVLVYFLSLAFATRYGSQHEISKFALYLRAIHKIDMRPLTTFADRNVEEEADRVELERVWQKAAPLAETIRRVLEVLGSSASAAEALTAEWPDLAPRLSELLTIAECAAAQDARVRLSFDL